MATLTSIKNKYLDVADGTVLGVTTNTENVSALSLKLATADSLSQFNLIDGFADDYNDATGVDASASTDETRDSSGKYYSGYALVPTGGNSSSGTLTTYGSYAVNTFLTSSTFDAGINGGTVDLLMVGGGGSGGGRGGASGGGGAGGLLYKEGFTLSSGTSSITIGSGGTGTSNAPGNDGTATTAFGNTANGGGTGGTEGARNGATGGSGGGGMYDSNGGSASQPNGTGGLIGYANGGGNGYNAGEGNPNQQAGGGGGAGGAGVNAASNNAGDGGTGKTYTIRSGASVVYAAGGGGGSRNNSMGAGGSSGVGGRGGSGAQTAGDGVANTGSGGGGIRADQAGSGADGIVVIRYTADSLTFNVDTYNDMTLVSNSTTAQSDPTTARIILDEYTSTGSATLNTDIKAYVSRDNGGNYTQITLANQGTIETNHRLLSGSVDISGQPSGTSVKYKIETLNQSSSKVTRVYGASMAWA